MNSNKFMHDFVMKILRADFEKGMDIGFVGELAMKYLLKGYLTEEDIVEVNSWYEEIEEIIEEYPESIEEEFEVEEVEEPTDEVEYGI